MERLEGLDKYFKEKDRKKLDLIAKESNSMGIPEMTKEEIKQSCVENGGYELPELNDKLYLHFKGFKTIENLEEYTACKALWLDSNGLCKIENLEALVEIRCLYMSKNLLSKIEGLHTLVDLVQLDLSNNRITHIEGLSCCPNLDSLNISRNALTTPESIEHLKECKVLRTLDLQNNKLEASDNFIEVFKQFPKLCTLSVNGNEITKIQTFRKRMIYNLPAMGFLDRPVEEQEKLAATAFMTGGPEAEKVAREEWRQAQADKRKKEMEDFKIWQAEQQVIRASQNKEQTAARVAADVEKTRLREIAADDASEIERRAIQEIGIAKISKRVSQLESAGEGGHDVVGLAQRQLVAEKDGLVESPYVEVLEDENQQDLPAVPSMSPTKHTDFDELDGDGDEDEEEEKPTTTTTTMVIEEVDEVVMPPPAPVESEEEKQDRLTKEKIAAEEAAVVAAAKKALQDAEDERQERVAHSIAIYKQQKEAGKSGADGPKIDKATTWDTAIQPVKKQGLAGAGSEEVEIIETDPELINKRLYWTEDMDIILAKEVKSKVFDFDLVSQEMLNKFGQKQLTAEVCRLRWADLDSGDQSVLETNFKCYVTDSVINATKGHGGQPTFESLGSIAGGQFPSYLSPPAAFPSVNDLSDDSDDEAEDNDKESK